LHDALSTQIEHDDDNNDDEDDDGVVTVKMRHNYIDSVSTQTNTILMLS
jgi:hypothetical protein